MTSPKRSLDIALFGHRLTVVSDNTDEDVRALVAGLEAQLERLKRLAPSASTEQIALLTALNASEELARTRAELDRLKRRMRARASRMNQQLVVLERMLGLEVAVTELPHEAEQGTGGAEGDREAGGEREAERKEMREVRTQGRDRETEPKEMREVRTQGRDRETEPKEMRESREIREVRTQGRKQGAEPKEVRTQGRKQGAEPKEIRAQGDERKEMRESREVREVRTQGRNQAAEPKEIREVRTQGRNKATHPKQTQNPNKTTEPSDALPPAEAASSPTEPGEVDDAVYEQRTEIPGLDLC